MSNIYRKQGINTGSGGGSIDTSALANKTDLTAIILTGSTNTSGDVISAGTWFYLNGMPCIAKVDIASNATFTLNTNYEEKTIGAELAELNSNKLSTKLTYTVIGNTIAPGDSVIVSDIAQWVVNNKFIGSLSFDYYGTWAGQLVSTYDGLAMIYFITVCNQIGARYYIRVRYNGQIIDAAKITGTITPIT